MAEQTVESLQIIVDANVKKAWTQLDALQKRLGQLQSQVNKSFAPKMDAIKSAMQSAAAPMEQVKQQADKIKQAVSGVGEAIAKPMQQAAQAVSQVSSATGGAASSIESAMNSILNSSKSSLSELQANLAETTAQIRKEQKELDGLKNSLQEGITAVGGNVGHTALAGVRKEVDQAQASVDALKSKAIELNNAIRLNQAQDSIQETSEAFKQIPIDEISIKMEAFKASIIGVMDTLIAKIDITKQKLDGILSDAKALPAGATPTTPTVTPAAPVQTAWIDSYKAKLTAAGVTVSAAFAKVSSETKKVKDNTEKATASTKKYGDQVKTVTAKAGGMFAKLGEIIKRALIIGVLYKAFRELFTFISTGIKNAIAAPEIENLFRVAMGNMADEAAAFAVQFRKALGVDEYTTKQMLGTFQNMNTAMGVGANTAYTMSKSLTILANDMASLYNVPVEQAFENLQSALTGQGRAVKKYGYVVNETTMKEAAWRNGLVATGQELSSAQKPIAAYLALMEQSGNAQGDMARTINSLQNQLRILKSNITAAGRAIGEAFLPFLQAVVPWLNAFFVLVQRAGTALARFTYSLFGKDYDAEKKKQEQIITGIGGVADAEDALGDAAEGAGKKAKGALASFDKLNVIQSNAESNADVGTGGGVEVPGLPELGIPDTESPFEKMADNILKKLKEIKDKMMDLGLREVLDNFKDFFAAIKQQIDQYDFATAIKDALWNGFELAMSLINAAQRIVFPIVIALDIPGIVYEAINTLSSLFAMLNDAVRAVTPGLEAFVQIGLVPIAKWLGGKIRDGLKFLQEQFEKIGAWFTAHTTDFTAFGEALGNLTNALWEVVKPLLDTAWSTFKGIISGIVDIVLKIADTLLKTLTPALNKISDWIKKNQKSITRFFEIILNLILQIVAVKGIKLFFDVFSKGIKGLLKNMEVARMAILKFTGAIMDLTKKGAVASLTSGFKGMGTAVVASFKRMGAALATFGKAVWAFVTSNPWMVAITAVLALATAIGVTLYNEHKRTVAAMEENNMKKAFDGVPVSLEAVKAAMQGVVEKYDALNQKVTDHQTTMQGLKTEYQTTMAAIDAAFISLESGTANAGISAETLSTNLAGLSTNLKTQVDTDGQYFFNTWNDIFSNTSALTVEREQEILAEITTGTENKKAEIDRLEGEIDALLAQWREAEVNGEKEKSALIQAELKERYAALAAIGEQEQARQAEIDKQRQMLLAREILEGRQKVTKENYQELLGQIDTDEQSARDSVINYQAEARANLESFHKSRMDELESEGASQAEIDQQVKDYNDSLSALNENYANSIKDIGVESIKTKTLLLEALEGPAKKAQEVQDEFQGIQDKINELGQTVAVGSSIFTAGYVGTEELKNAKTELEGMKDKLQELVNQNPEMFKQNWLGQFDFTATEAANASREIQGAIETSIDDSKQYAATEGGTISKNLFDGLKAGVNERLTDIQEAVGSVADGMIERFNTDFQIHSPSQVMYEKGSYIVQGLVDGITATKEAALVSLVGLFTSMMESVTKFTADSVLAIQKWSEEINIKLNEFAKTINENYKSFTDKFKEAYNKDLQSLKSTLTATMSGMSSSVSGAVSSMISSLDKLIQKVNSAMKKLEELSDMGGTVRSVGSSSGRSNSRKSPNPYTRAVPVPALAQGGVLRRSTLVNVAEYAGAASNPEIVAPQSIMYDTFIEANAPMVAALSRKLDQIIQAIGRIDPTIQIGDDVIHASNERESIRRGNMFSMA